MITLTNHNKEAKDYHESFFFSSVITLADSLGLFYCLILYIFFLAVYLQTKLMTAKSNRRANIMSKRISFALTMLLEESIELIFLSI